MFNVDEVFQIAENIEVTGAKYYRAAAKLFADRRCAQVLQTLARMEDEHLKQFTAIHQKVKRTQHLPETWDPEGEAGEYLRALTSHKVFRPQEDPSQRLTGHESLKQILELAIKMEKDSIVFYAGLKEMVPQELGRDQVDDIIKQEMGHITTLTQELTQAGE